MAKTAPYMSPGAEEHLEYWRYQHPRPESFVYVAQAIGDSPIKVGIATDVVARLAGLQTGNPRQLLVWHVLVGDSELECQLHRRLKDCRLLGEWFDGPAVPAFMEFVGGLAGDMLASHKKTDELPHFKNFAGFNEWDRTRHQAPVTTRFERPEPQTPEQVNERLRQHYLRADVARTRSAA